MSKPHMHSLFIVTLWASPPFKLPISQCAFMLSAHSQFLSDRSLQTVDHAETWRSHADGYSLSHRPYVPAPRLQGFEVFTLEVTNEDFFSAGLKQTTWNTITYVQWLPLYFVVTIICWCWCICIFCFITYRQESATTIGNIWLTEQLNFACFLKIISQCPPEQQIRRH